MKSGTKIRFGIHPDFAFMTFDDAINDREAKPNPFDLPKIKNTGNPVSDRKEYLEALEDHDDRTGVLLLPAGLKRATCPVEEIPFLSNGERKTLANPDEIALEVARRVNPDHYAQLWDKALKEVKQEIARLGRPLATQSIGAIDNLLGEYDPSTFDEEQFIHKELQADAALYRDPKFLEGLRALLDRSVPDFRQPAGF